MHASYFFDVLSVLIIHFFIMQAEIMEIQMNEVISFVNCEAKLFYIWHIYYLGVLSDLLKLRKRYRHYSAYNHSITLSPYDCG